MPEIRDQRKPGWFWMDNRALSMELNPSALATYAALCRMANNGTQAVIAPVPAIARVANVDTRTAQRALGVLVERGMVYIEQRETERGRQIENAYHLLDVSEWRRAGDKLSPLPTEAGDNLTGYAVKLSPAGGDKLSPLNLKTVSSNEKEFSKKKKENPPPPPAGAVVDEPVSPLFFSVCEHIGITSPKAVKSLWAAGRRPISLFAWDAYRRQNQRIVIGAMVNEIKESELPAAQYCGDRLSNATAFINEQLPYIEGGAPSDARARIEQALSLWRDMFRGFVPIPWDSIAIESIVTEVGATVADAYDPEYGYQEYRVLVALHWPEHENADWMRATFEKSLALFAHEFEVTYVE